MLERSLCLISVLCFQFAVRAGRLLRVVVIFSCVAFFRPAHTVQIERLGDNRYRVYALFMEEKKNREISCYFSSRAEAEKIYWHLLLGKQLRPASMQRIVCKEME